MGIIQNAINQMLGTAGIAARLAPGYESRQELHKLNKKDKSLEALQENTDYAEQTVESITREQVDISKRIAELNPTKENVKKYIDYSESLTAMQPENIEAERQVAAMKKAAEKQETARKQKENRENYVKLITDPQIINTEFKKLQGGLIK